MIDATSCNTFNWSKQHIQFQHQHPLEDEQLEQQNEQACGQRRTMYRYIRINIIKNKYTYIAIDFVHGNKVIHILEENSCLDYLVKTGAGSFQDSFEILENLFSLFLDSTFYNIA